MEKTIVILFCILLATPIALALDIKVNEIDQEAVMVYGLDEPVIFNIEIHNSGADDNLEFYNLLGFQMFPVGTVPIATGETKKIELKASPIGEFDYRGAYTFEYYIRGQDKSEMKRTLSFKIVKFEDAFEIGSGEFNPELSSIKIYIQNKLNFDFEKIDAKFSSAFFNFDKSFSLGLKEKKEFDVQVNKEDFKKLMAGFYTLNAEVESQGQKTELEGTIKFIEKGLLTTTKKDYGFIINTQLIKKTNEGNVVSLSTTTLKKNIISRLFTTFSPEPDIVDREGILVYYTWEKEIKPGEDFEIAVRTNWTFPLIIVLFIITIVILAKQYSKTNLVLKKKVSFVMAKGGEFALRISVKIQAKKHIEKVTVLDRLPPLVKLYEKFGAEKPTRVDEKNKRIEWNFNRMNAGEIRIVSYVIYSKLGVVGKFALPSATAIYEREGEIQETESNKTFFVAEQGSKDLEE